jgi:DNA mismatch endonuclease (patch repair protein)
MSEYEEERLIKVPRFEEKHGFSTTLQRSLLMSKIKGKNTTPEMLLRKILWKGGLRYRLHNKKLPGNPDIVIRKFMLVIFIDGEFWHGYNWEQKKTKIQANRDFWIPKIERNMQRDSTNNTKLTNMGFRVFRFWEQRIKKDLTGIVEEIFDYIKSATSSDEVGTP